MENSKDKARGITIGQMKEAMQLFAEATDADALRRVTESVICRMEASSEANEILKGGF
jgi:tRNA threonylcarbamoyladenosine modification (KEOPS) complex  Pcc1 subunit